MGLGEAVEHGAELGEAEARAGDYYGPALNRAARLMSVGQGGQILVSAVTAELARDRLPAGLQQRLVDRSVTTLRAMPQGVLRQVLTHLGALVLPKPEVMVPKAQEVFDETGRLTSETTRGFLQDLLVKLADWTKRVNN